MLSPHLHLLLYRPPPAACMSISRHHATNIGCTADWAWLAYRPMRFHRRCHASLPISLLFSSASTAAAPGAIDHACLRFHIYFTIDSHIWCQKKMPTTSTYATTSSALPIPTSAQLIQRGARKAGLLGEDARGRFLARPAIISCLLITIIPELTTNQPPLPPTAGPAISTPDAYLQRFNPSHTSADARRGIFHTVMPQIRQAIEGSSAVVAVSHATKRGRRHRPYTYHTSVTTLAHERCRL